MKKFDFLFVFKIIFIIAFAPCLFITWIFINSKYNMECFHSLFIYLIVTVLLFDLFLIKDIYDNWEYRKYNLQNPDKRKINCVIIFMAIFSVVALPHMIIKPMLNASLHPILMIAVFLLYLFLTSVYGGFIYKLIIDFSKYGNKVLNLKYKTYNYTDLIVFDIKKINTYQKVITFNNHIIVINQAGIFEIIIFNEKGNIEGNIKKTIWSYNNKNFNNPFVINEGNTNYLAILNNIINFNVLGVIVIQKNNINNYMEKKVSKIILNQNEIDMLFEKIKKELNLKNVNYS